MDICTRVEPEGEIVEILPEKGAKRRELANSLNSQGFRAIALAYKQMPGATDEPVYSAADVGISVDGAVYIAKESFDITLLENSLLALEQGVLEGRRVFGNMFSVIGASAFLRLPAPSCLPPMLPIQVLTNNLLYDFSQITIPADKVGPEWLTKPRQ